jgi:hypothetical protein
MHLKDYARPREASVDVDSFEHGVLLNLLWDWRTVGGASYESRAEADMMKTPLKRQLRINPSPIEQK